MHIKTLIARVYLKINIVNVVMQAGDILVVICTDVGWSPYFPLIAGLVSEMGGMISHGAVVAREYGIPCVVSIPNATLRLKNGQWIFPLIKVFSSNFFTAGHLHRLKIKSQHKNKI
jgi:pyruvate,water dikinase